MSESVETQATVEASGCGCGGTPETPEAERQNLELSAATSAPVIPVAQIPNPVITSQGVSMPETTNKPVTPSQAAEPAGGIVYAIGTLGYDFGTEARRDTFKQLMPTAVIGGIVKY